MHAYFFLIQLFIVFIIILCMWTQFALNQSNKQEQLFFMASGISDIYQTASFQSSALG